MGSNQSTFLQQNDTSLPSIYCIYSDKCPSRNRSAICVPCLYKNITGQIKPPIINDHNPNCSERINCSDPISNLKCDSCLKYMRSGVFGWACKCSHYKLCGTCYNYMKDYVFPPGDKLSLMKPYEADNNFAKF